MAFIGYSASGYESLISEINSRKSKLLSLLGDFAEIQQNIGDCWKGADADAYLADLTKMINNTKTSVESTYDAMSSQFRKTYNDWVEKQNGGHATM